MAEAVLPETDDDAVRIMTIHAAKGLEFPITIVSGLSTAPQAPAQPGRGASSRPTGGRSATSFGQGRRHRGVRGLDARSTSRWATTSASASSTSPAPGPATTSSCRSTARTAGQPARGPEQAHQRRAARSTGWATRARRPARRRRRRRGRCRSARAARRRHRPPPFDDVARRARRGPRRGARPGAVAATALTDEGAPDAAAEPTAERDLPRRRRRPTTPSDRARPPASRSARATSTCRRG